MGRRGQGRSTLANRSLPGQLLESVIGPGDARGRLRDPKTYLLMAAATFALQWLEQHYLGTDEFKRDDAD